MHNAGLVPRIGLLALVLVCLAALLAPATASAAFRAKTSVASANGASRIVVKLTSTTRLSARTRPRSVKVKVGRKLYALSRVRGTAVAAVAAGTWRSAAYRGAAGAAIAALAGKRVSVRVGSLAGTVSLPNTVARPPSATPTPGVTAPALPGGSAPPASRPAEVSGEEGKRQFHEALVGRRLRWTNQPSGYDAAETWGFCPDVVYQRYVSSTLDPAAWQTQSYNYTVTAGFVHPASLPQAELLGQIQLANGPAYNIAFAYGRQTGAWAKVGSSTDYPFTVAGYTCGEELPN